MNTYVNTNVPIDTIEVVARRVLALVRASGWSVGEFAGVMYRFESGYVADHPHKRYEDKVGHKHRRSTDP